MIPERHQFGKAGQLAGNVESWLTRWFKAVTALAPDFWNKALPFKATMTAAGFQLATVGEALAALPEPSVAFRVKMARENPTLLVLPRSLALTLLAGLFGDASNDPVTDRPLTAVEDDMCQYFFQQVFLPPLSEAWPGRQGLALALDQLEPYPQWTRTFGGIDFLVACTFVVQGPFGEEKGQWLVPYESLADLIGAEDEDEEEIKGPQLSLPQTCLEEGVRELPVEITVQLGKADISLSQLAGLRPGDLLILGQPVSQPLLALVEGEKNLYVWAGRVGDWKAIQIDSI
jgi:flagellar motor switch protein FliM